MKNVLLIILLGFTSTSFTQNLSIEQAAPIIYEYLQSAQVPFRLIVVGLGNMQNEYLNTRHNAGAILLSQFITHVPHTKIELNDWEETLTAKNVEEAKEIMEFVGAGNPKLDGLKVTYQVGGTVYLPTLENSSLKGVVFFIPKYDINTAGIPVSVLLNSVDPSFKILVLVDDMNSNINQKKGIQLKVLKYNPSFRGHNGVKSIMSMNGRDFALVTLGTSNPKAEGQEHLSLAEWVLGQIPPEQMNFLISDQVTKYAIPDFIQKYALSLVASNPKDQSRYLQQCHTVLQSISPN